MCTPGDFPVRRGMPNWPSTSGVSSRGVWTGRGRPGKSTWCVDFLMAGRRSVVKMHHALVDGMAALGIGMVLLDTERTPPPVESAGRLTAAPEDVLHRYLARLAASSATKPARLLWSAADRYLLAPSTAEADVRRAQEVLARLIATRSGAPRLPFNRTISANRSYAFGGVELRAVRKAGRSGGGTADDVVLAAVCGMVERYLVASGVDVARLPDDPVALVPVSRPSARRRRVG